MLLLLTFSADVLYLHFPLKEMLMYKPRDGLCNQYIDPPTYVKIRLGQTRLLLLYFSPQMFFYSKYPFKNLSFFKVNRVLKISHNAYDYILV